MFDYDLAVLYDVSTKVLNQSVKRNFQRFPEDFMFRLTAGEWQLMRSQVVTASEKIEETAESGAGSQKKRNTKVTPYAFTEHGVTMLASILRSEHVIRMNIAIVRAFTAMRQAAYRQYDMKSQMQELRIELQNRLSEHDTQLTAIYDALENMLDKKEDEVLEKQKWLNRERISFKK